VFRKILVANRGEIACRIMRTAKRMGIATVAVYSHADRDALHVEMADEAVDIGPAPASQSYLLAEKIVEASKNSGADAVHPGYGFLSERPSFCEALEREGITFIGPKSSAIEAMGDKITSKKIAAEAGVPTIPGFMGIVANADHAAEIAAGIGYPVMIKASAGGGGKGMRIAWNDVEAREGFERARSEAASSFGDDRIFIEKFVEEPRHIEIQVLADTHGTALYLGERECSIQRRNQKVVEEAPSPFLNARTRKAMGEQAVALARAVGYQSAGTVEFIVDRDAKFYFLEMNTRLQVEHPVTELITGIDLVEQMIRVAAGERLPFAQKDIDLKGWAIESRIYAEDPYRGFLPSTGRLTRYRPPAARSTSATIIRNDTGVVEGSEISIYYDPMIAKLCTWAPDRAAAIDAMATALDEFVIDGIRHNIPFLSVLMQHPRWREGMLSTTFIAEEFPDGCSPTQPADADIEVFAAVALSVELARRLRLDRFGDRLKPHTGAYRRDWEVRLGDTYLPVSVEGAGDGFPKAFRMQIRSGGSVSVGSGWTLGAPVWSGKVGDRAVSVQVRPLANGVSLSWGGVSVEASVMLPDIAALFRIMPNKVPPDTSKALLCPMPGLVVAVNVANGQAVKAGEVLAIVEAMKMENVLRAERDLTVARVLVVAGDSLSVDAVIMEFA
jgi:propionyl-CoA carboxylase alpha chain